MKIKTGKYNGVVCELTNVRPHRNADRLQVANALGYSVIVGLDAKEGDVVVCFPEGGKLSHEFLMANNLYRKNPITKEPMGGYFEEKGRIKQVKLRSENSEAFVTSLKSLDYLGEVNLKVGDEFCSIGDNKICEKYYTAATIKAMKQAAKKYRKPKWLPKFLVPLHKKYIVNKAKHDPCPTFKKVGETTKLRQYVNMIPEDLIVHWSSKRHGTSGRTGLVPYDDRGRLAKLLRKPVPYKYVTGTRNVVKNPATFGKRKDDGYYQGTDFRYEAHKQMVGLQKDEIIYYELLGFCNEVTPIMPNHVLKWKDFQKEGFTKDEFNDIVDIYSEQVTYHYGNEPGNFSIEVYRITQNGKDLSNEKMLERCKELGLNPVPQLGKTGSDIDLMAHAKELAEEQDEDGQLREGVVLRLEDKEGNLVKNLKYKSAIFCTLEGIKRNDKEYIDMEEIN